MVQNNKHYKLKVETAAPAEVPVATVQAAEVTKQKEKKEEEKKRRSQGNFA